jgi:hypothetical protein
MRLDRGRAHDLGARRIARHVAEHTNPGDTIWAWGWHLWDIYPLTGLLSGSRIYKSLGLLTQQNDDTWRRRPSRLRFVERSFATMLIEDLSRTRPAYVILGSTVPHRDFRALHRLLDERYERDRRIRVGRVELWRIRPGPLDAANAPDPRIRRCGEHRSGGRIDRGSTGD